MIFQIQVDKIQDIRLPLVYLFTPWALWLFNTACILSIIVISDHKTSPIELIFSQVPTKVSTSQNRSRRRGDPLGDDKQNSLPSKFPVFGQVRRWFVNAVVRGRISAGFNHHDQTLSPTYVLAFRSNYSQGVVRCHHKI